MDLRVDFHLHLASAGFCNYDFCITMMESVFWYATNDLQTRIKIPLKLFLKNISEGVRDLPWTCKSKYVH